MSLALCSLFVHIALDSEKKEPIKVINASYKFLTNEAKKQVDCLAENIYFESAHEPKEGKIAVAFVTLNRVKSGIFPNNICDVVKQQVNNVCQFSWWCQDKQRHMSVNKVLTKNSDMVYNDIRELAVHVYVNHDYLEDPSNGALFYHADYVNPGWDNLRKTRTIGRHIFYERKRNI
jgi:N-acetylmuramoyl-L-alanine amidase